MKAPDALTKYDTTISALGQKIFCMLTPEHAPEKFICFKYSDPIYGLDIQLSPTERKLNTMHIYYLQSVGVLFGYLFKVDKLTATMYTEYFTVLRPSIANVEMYSGVELVYQSPYINVYESQEGAALVSTNNMFKVITSDLVRKSATK